MCPDRELISAYYDGELDGRWAFEIEKHISECGSCAEKLGTYRRISGLLGESSVPDEEQIRKRIPGAVRRKSETSYIPFWRRNISISIPAVAAAAALAVVFFAGFFIGNNPLSSGTEVVEEIPVQTEKVNLQVISLEDAAAYILSDDSGFDVLITIPPSENLSVAGEPKLIRSADYKRGDY